MVSSQNVTQASSSPAPQNYCTGFPDPTVPILTSEPFLAHSIPSSHNFIPPAVADYDNDGDPDLPWAVNLGNWNWRYVGSIDDLIESSGYAAVLRRNLRNRPTVPKAILDELLSFHGVAALDFNDDGRQDFMLDPYYQTGIPIMLFRNLGNWQFEFAHQDYFHSLLGFNSTSTWYSETIIWADMTDDGINDIYIPFYTYPGTEPGQSVFLRNTGTGFVEEAMARGIGLPNIPLNLRPEGAQAIDIDGDGDLDFYVAHHLFINDGAGNFTDARAAYGLPVMFDEGVAFVDYDNDGLMDLYVRSLDYYQSTLLFRNTGSGFVNTTISSGLACLMQSLGFNEGDAWADFDRDGDQDLMITFDETNPRYALFLNQGDGTFRLGYMGSRLIDLPAAADFDNDGDMDLGTVLASINEIVLSAPVGNRDLAVIPLDAKGRPSETGTSIRLHSDCTSQIQSRVTGTNNVYLAQGEYASHFAVSSDCGYQIEVTFPKKGALPRQTLNVPYDPATEGSLRITVTRSGYSKLAYGTIYKYYFPEVNKVP